MKRALILGAVLIGLTSSVAQACTNTTCTVVPPIVCAQVVTPVPGMPGYFYSDSCRTTIIKIEATTPIITSSAPIIPQPVNSYNGVVYSKRTTPTVIRVTIR
jgi:hypothetical protein